MPETAARDLAGKLIAFLETGAPPDGLFAPDVFCDFTLPQWRLQAHCLTSRGCVTCASWPSVPARTSPRWNWRPPATASVCSPSRRRARRRTPRARRLPAAVA
jgi:hypothetical protein